MAEIISEEQPRIKFNAQRDPEPHLITVNTIIDDLADLMSELESSGAIPVLVDGLVAGNCAVVAEAVNDAAAQSSIDISPEQRLEKPIYVSRSGKAPAARMAAQDFALVTSFDPRSWTVAYQSASENARPTSDTPLHVAALDSKMTSSYGWAETPVVAAHGHALAEGEGLAVAQHLGLPISHQATLFSTPEDLHQLQQLFKAHPYPQHRCYIRRGHGFFLLGKTVGEVRQYFRSVILPHLGCVGGER